MSGHGTRARRRAAVGALAALSIGLFGAAASADDGDAGRGEPRAAAPTTEPSGTIGGDLGSTPPSDPPDGLGTDPELDALAQACYDGDLVACDHLFLQSPVDSEYEEYGDTCAGRQEAGTENYCGLVPGEGQPVVPDVPVEPTPPNNLGADPALDALASECYVGDMDACDELYGAAEQGSEYQIYGDTCAGRQPENTGRYCRDLENPVPGTGPIASLPDSVPPETVLPDTVPPESVPPESIPPESIPPETVPPPESSVAVVDVPTTTQGAVPPPTEEPVGLGADPALDALAQSCYDGDMAACDNLYNSSEPDSDYRRYGDTCAGRQSENTGVWCRTAFGDGTPSTDVTVPPISTLPVSTLPVPTLPVPTLPVPTPPLTAPPLTVPPLTSPPLTVPPITQPIVPTLPVLPTVPIFTLPTIPGSTTPGTTVPGAIPPPTRQPTGLGTNPAFDALAQSCFDGDMAACDELFRQADPELDVLYRDFADTCAGRQPAGTGRWCEAAFPATGGPTSVPGTTVPGTGPVATVPGTVVTGIPPATQQPTALGNDPQLNLLAQSCFDGDMQACDDLFLQSELGSTYHEYGDTCAGRQPAGTYTYCRVAFPATQP